MLRPLSAASGGSAAYTPFGWRSLGELDEGALVFNGQIKEVCTCCYYLGNGNRVFNPILMRFHRPDDQSPFGLGGINCYAYCSGEPINRLDHSGRTWRPIKNALRSRKLIRPSVGPVNKSALIELPGQTIARNIKRHGSGIFSFERGERAPKMLVINAHGLKKTGAQISSGANKIDADNLYKKLLDQGVNFDEFSSVHLQICFSGYGGKNSSAARFAGLAGLPTTGYEGPVSSNLGADSMRKLFNSLAIQEVPVYPISGVPNQQLNIWRASSSSAGHKVDYRPVTYIRRA